jgi:hypothetical protein
LISPANFRNSTDPMKTQRAVISRKRSDASWSEDRILSCDK